MKVTILLHPDSWMDYRDTLHFIPTLSKYMSTEDVSHYKYPTTPGDVCIALHYPALLTREQRALHKFNLVIHGSDLPRGRGRSPIHWQVEGGCNQIILTLFEMGDEADTGGIYRQDVLFLDGTELLPDIRRKILRAEVEMVDWFFRLFPPPCVPQTGVPTYYKKRSPEDQRLDIEDSIVSQFDKMRVADNNLYPLWFEMRGVEYELKITSRAPRLKVFPVDDLPLDMQGVAGEK